MLRLFEFDNYEVKVSPEALMLKPFSVIWKRDKTKTKQTAMQELAFIYFFCDPRSDYQYLVDEKERLEAIREGEGLDRKWKPDETLKAAMEFYRSFQPASALLLQDTNRFVDKFRAKLRDITFDDLDVGDSDGLKLMERAGAIIKQIPGFIKMLADAEKIVRDQSDDMQGQVRGSKEKSILDDGLDDI